MCRLPSLSFIVVATVGFASSASAQTIVDLSQPQTGKSRFVLNADMTPADLGAAAEAAKPIAVVSRVPACGEGCRLEQPVTRRDSAHGSRDERGSSGARRGTGMRVIVVNNANGNQTQQASKPAAAPSKTLRLRRR
jgi:hypothetical protein